MVEWTTLFCAAGPWVLMKISMPIINDPPKDDGNLFKNVVSFKKY